jgi:hypothetical protein
MIPPIGPGGKPLGIWRRIRAPSASVKANGPDAGLKRVGTIWGERSVGRPTGAPFK